MKRIEYKKNNQNYKINQTKVIEHLVQKKILNCPTPNNVLYSNNSYPDCVCTENTIKQLEFPVPFVAGSNYQFQCS
jgi:hypothetical protein